MRGLEKFWANYKYDHSVKVQCQHMGATLDLFYANDEYRERYNPIYPLRKELQEIEE